MSPVEVRSLIADFGAENGTLRRGADSCSVLVAISTPREGGSPIASTSTTRSDARRAYIAAVDSAGAAIAITPTFGDRLERGAKAYGLGKVRTIDPDGEVVAYVAEVQS